MVKYYTVSQTNQQPFYRCSSDFTLSLGQRSPPKLVAWHAKLPPLASHDTDKYSLVPRRAYDIREEPLFTIV